MAAYGWQISLAQLDCLKYWYEIPSSSSTNPRPQISIFCTFMVSFFKIQEGHQFETFYENTISILQWSISNNILNWTFSVFGTENQFHMIFAIYGGSTLLGGRGKKASPMRHLNDQKLQLMTGICSSVVRDNFGA